MLSTLDFFCWNSLYKTIENIVNKKEDVLVALAHFLMTQQWNFLCIGLGEEKLISANDEVYNFLPEGWNKDENKYTLRYVFNGHLYLMFAHKIESLLIINLIDFNTKNVSNVTLNTEEIPNKFKENYHLYEMIPNAPKILYRYQKELIEPVYCGNTRLKYTTIDDINRNIIV